MTHKNIHIVLSLDLDTNTCRVVHGFKSEKMANLFKEDLKDIQRQNNHLYGVYLDSNLEDQYAMEQRGEVPEDFTNFVYEVITIPFNAAVSSSKIDDSNCLTKEEHLEMQIKKPSRYFYGLDDNFKRGE
jgi:hypothetical protein